MDLAAEDRSRIGVSVGTSLGGAISQEAAYADIFLKQVQSRLSPFTLVKVMYNGPSRADRIAVQARRAILTYSTTCSSSAVSIGEAMRQIRHGYADVMIAGGSEALFAYVSIKAWLGPTGIAPERPGNASATCRPFSLDRNGTVLGDGAAFVVLEEYERAVARGAHVHAELAGYGVCNDSSHMTQPSVAGQARAMRLALGDAGLAPEAIDYINAHGTGTQLNDLTETEAVKEVFGKHAYSIAVSSTKSMHGHLVGTAGALELVICTLALQAPNGSTNGAPGRAGSKVRPRLRSSRRTKRACSSGYVELVRRWRNSRLLVSEKRLRQWQALRRPKSRPPLSADGSRRVHR